MPATIDVVVRFHDMGRLMELERCLFSLTTQSYRPLRVILCTQRFTDQDRTKLHSQFDRLFDEDGLHLDIVDYAETQPKDARTALFKMGVEAATGRYLAFLDYDDVLYSEAYEMLIRRLQQTGAGISFASVRVAAVDVYERTLYTKEMDVQSFPGRDVLDLMRNNFCPLHSYVIDRGALPEGVPSFDPAIIWEEDYAMLLQVIAAVPADFGLLDKQIGLYAFKSDGSNTVANTADKTDESHERYKHVIATMQNLKDTIMVSDRVQAHLKLKKPETPRSISDVMKLLQRKAFLAPLTS